MKTKVINGINYMEKNEVIFFNNIISNLDYSEWNIPAIQDNDYFLLKIYGSVAESVEEKGYERPDLILIKDKKVVSAVEVFKVDGTKNIKESQNDKEYFTFVENDERKAVISGGNNYSSQDFEYSFSLTSYIKKFKDTFNDHYDKIIEYKKNLCNLGYSGDIGFVIVDSFYNPVTFNDGVPFNPLCVNELLEFMRGKSNIHYFIFYQNSGNQPNVIFLKNNHESIQYVYDKFVKVDNTTIFSNPKTKHVRMGLTVNLKLDDKIEYTVITNDSKEGKEDEKKDLS